MMGLVDRHGRPLSSKQFENKKAAPPALGERYGQWAGEATPILTLPGGGALAFDTSKLTLADFRQMRGNYQINSSLSILTFMMHQMDWHIESPKQGVADLVEVQLRRVWSRLVRAHSQALWCGYGPNVLQWENDFTGREVVLAKIKDLVPETARVHWKKVESPVPGFPNAKSVHHVYDGINQWGSIAPIPVECPTVDTPILMADFSWKKAGDVEEGDVVLAFDENERLKGRRYRKSLVEANLINTKKCVTVETRDGQPITVSMEHPFLVRRGPVLTGVKETSIYKDHWTWVKAKDLRIDDKIGFFGQVWDRDQSREAGYVAGIFDGEGHVNWSPSGNSVHIGFSQREGKVLTETLRILDAKGFDYVVQSNNRDDCKEIRILGGRREIARFMEVFAPARLGDKVADMFDDTVMRIEKSIGVTEVVAVSHAGEQQVASIQTETRTYISAGYLSHNCSYWYPLLMENGNYYGRRLLESAFQPWFFSVLLHLFANRYYERFGEPTPVGRAPYDDEIDVNGTPMKGNQLMALLLQQIRNRSVVVLPSEKTAAGDSDNNPDFDYQIEYLESQMRGADFERYMTRLDEEMSLAMFTPILMMRTADVGSYNLGTQHTQVYQWMLNALAGDWAEYINKYIIAPIVAYNFNGRPVPCEIKFTKMGKTNSQLLQAVITSLLEKGAIEFDARELGEMSGLTVNEVEVVTGEEEPPPPEEEPDPEQDDQTAEVKRLIIKRVRPQVEKAFRNNTFGELEFAVNMGYKRQLSEAFKKEGLVKSGNRVDDLYDLMDNWLGRTCAYGVEEYETPDAYMALFERKLTDSIEVFRR